MFSQKVIALAAGIFGFLLAGSPAIAWTVGDAVVIGAYCNISDEAYMKEFAESLAVGGVPKYLEIMNDKTIFCVDERLHEGIKPIEVEFIQKMYTLTMPEGPVIEVWKLKDAGGTTGFTWVSIQGDGV